MKRLLILGNFLKLLNFLLSERSRLQELHVDVWQLRKKSDLALMAWAQEARIKARNIQTASINIKGLTSVLNDIRKMTVLSPKEFCPKIKKNNLADCGYCFSIFATS